MRRRFSLIYNSTAGFAHPRLLKRVVARLNAEGASVDMLQALSADEASRRVAAVAIAGSADAVIAAGGDGTIRAAAAGVAGTAMPLGFIPLGTGNVMKYEVGLRSNARDIANVLCNGPEICARGGLVNGAPFFLMAGAGFDGRIVADLDYKTKRTLGRLAYGGPIARALLRAPDELDVEIDGRHYAASWVIVANAAHYGGSFVVTRDTHLGSGKLVAVLIEGKSRAALLRAALALALGRLSRSETRPPEVQAIPAERVRITAQTPVPVEIDGDEGGVTPIEVTGGGPQVRLIVPETYVADLTKRHANHLL